MKTNNFMDYKNKKENN